MSNFTLKQKDNELIFTVEGKNQEYTLTFNDKDQAAMIKPDIRDLLWAIESSYKSKKK